MGFDDVTAAGMNAFSVLSNVSENMNDEDIVKGSEPSFRAHSMNFAHSDYSDLNLMEQKCSLVDGECTEYAELLSFMAQVQVLA